LDKSQWRTQLLAARRSRGADEIATARAQVRAVLLAGLRPTVRVVAAYDPLRTEPGSVELIASLQAAGVQVLLPVRQPDNDLDWVSAADRSVALGLDVIARADLVLVPALAVDFHGTRLGRGGGSYDRALARVGVSVPVAALIYADELVAQLPAEPWDRPVTAVVTPDGWRTVGAPGWTGNASIPHHG
jgi:5-formyltetrahydrofolate cyclo-ligase